MVVVRPAEPTPAEASAFSDLVDMATEGLLTRVLGARTKPMLEGMFLRKGNDYSHEHVRFLTVDGRFAGMLSAIGEAESNANSFRNSLLLLRHLSWFLPVAFSRCRPLKHVLRFIYQRPADHFYVTFLAVHPEFRGRGFGTRLICEAESLALASGCPTLSLFVNPANSIAVRVYESCGMTVIDRSPDARYQDIEVAMIRMEKSLA